MLFAQVLPEGFEGAKRTAAKPVALSGEAVWEEYGLEVCEKADYSFDGKMFSITAYRLQDATAALGVFQWLRAPNARPSSLAPIAVETSDGALLAMGNYVLDFRGRKPEPYSLQQLALVLPRLETQSLPALTGFLPVRGLIPNSERFILGPATLAKFQPKVPASMAAFSFSAEAQVARYRAPEGELELTLFNYPTPQIARERLAEMLTLPAATGKMSGPLVAVIFSPPSADAAERLLAQVRYQANLSWNERVPLKDENWRTIILSIFELTGALLLFCVFAGLCFAGTRLLARKVFGDEAIDRPMILLHLNWEERKAANGER